MEIAVTGMIVSAMPIGEYDKRLVILTKERGKIHAFARGARKQHSPLLACSQPFTFGVFQVFEGRAAYTLSSAAVKEYFTGLKDDLELLCYGMYFLEIGDYYGKENLDAGELLNLLYLTLKIIEKHPAEIRLVRYIFEWRAVALDGLAPQLWECTDCKKEWELNRDTAWTFSPSAGGLVCADCARKTDASPISPAAVCAVQHILASPLKKAYSFTVSKEVLGELAQITGKYFKICVDKSFKSLEMIYSTSVPPIS